MDTLKHMSGVIVVDLQGNFTVFKKGALAVPGTDEIFINKIRNASEVLKKEGYPIFATQDWHPAGHISFYTNHAGRKPFDVIEVENRKQALWPSHCIQGTENTRLLLDEILFDAIVKKGKDRRHDSYSGFQDDGGDKTELNSLLKNHGIMRTHYLRDRHGLLRESNRLGRDQSRIPGSPYRRALSGSLLRNNREGVGRNEVQQNCAYCRFIRINSW